MSRPSPTPSTRGNRSRPWSRSPISSPSRRACSSASRKRWWRPPSSSSCSPSSARGRQRRRVRCGTQPRQYRDVSRHGAAAHARARAGAARARGAARTLSRGGRRHRAGACEGAGPDSGRATVRAARAPAGRDRGRSARGRRLLSDSRKRRPRACRRISLTASVNDISSELFVLQERENPVWSAGASLLAADVQRPAGSRRRCRSAPPSSARRSRTTAASVRARSARSRTRSSAELYAGRREEVLTRAASPRISEALDLARDSLRRRLRRPASGAAATGRRARLASDRSCACRPTGSCSA